MLSYVLSSASTYFYVPFEDEQGKDTDTDDSEASLPLIEWRDQDYSSSSSSSASSSGSSTPECSSSALPPSGSSFSKSSPYPNNSKGKNKQSTSNDSDETQTISYILSQNDLYKILGIPRSKVGDKSALRRAYLSRSRGCHPDKHPSSPHATLAFQKVCLAYDVLSKPSTRRLYDASPSPQSFFEAPDSGFGPSPWSSTRMGGNAWAEETFRGVVIGVFNDFLEGDLEMVRTLLRAINDINPALRLGEEGIDSVLIALESIRERALTCRTCILTLHTQLSLILSLTQSLRSLSYFDIINRSRLTIQLARITLNLPLAVEAAIRERGEDGGYYERGGGGRSGIETGERAVFLPKRVSGLIRGIVLVLERMERILK
ncbi:hypothetical protein JAAARDRAFT_183392 [Jaapia argillacea MUCL 33604]|uniref:J domain-containing protein n=1 Tax=Jaapia argillacea MUCL 33604 TaxID=933084 RepID=A0A067PP78_9AGAM|nr:hypothetical protein JAAARDRAFT_183392 [Jaapia argillacea MUCL 33604]